MATPATLRLTLPSDTAFLSIVTNLARNAAIAAGIAAKDAEKVALATDEAVTNVIEHAYHGRPGHRLELCFEIDAGSIAIHVIHRGDPIDEQALPSRYDAGELLRAGRRGGHGVVLMRRLMDAVEYRATADRQYECCLRMSRTPEGLAAPGRSHAAER